MPLRALSAIVLAVAWATAQSAPQSPLHDDPAIREVLIQIEAQAASAPESSIRALRALAHRIEVAPAATRRRAQWLEAQAQIAAARPAAALEIAVRLGAAGSPDDPLDGATGALIASAVAFAAGDYDAASRECARAYTLARSVAAAESDLLFETAARAGSVAAARGDGPTALRLLAEAEELSRSAGTRRRRALVLRTMASVYTMSGNPLRALTTARDAAALATAVGDAYLAADARTREAQAATLLADTRLERRALEAGLDAARSAGSLAGERLLLIQYADYSLRQGEFAAAVGASKRSLSLALAAGDASDTATSRANLGFALIRTGQISEGRRIAEAALVEYESSGAAAETTALLLEFARHFRSAGAYEAAASFYERHLRSVAERDERELARQVAELTAQFDAERRQRELERAALENARKADSLRFRNVMLLLSAAVAVALAVALLLLILKIRAKNRLEREIRRTESALRELVFDGQDVMLLLDSGGVVRVASRVGADFDVRAVVGRHYSESLSRAHAAAIRQALEALGPTVARHRIEFEDPDRSGETFELRAAIIFDELSAVGFVVRITDISEIRRSIERFRAQAVAFEAAGEGLVLVDAAGVIVLANGFARQLLRMGGSGSQPTSLSALGIPWSRVADAKARAEASDRVEFDFELPVGNGDRITCSAAFARVRSLGEIEYVGVFRDVSIRRAAQRRAVESEQRVRGRVALQLHESLSQELTGLSLLITALARAAGGGGSRSGGELLAVGQALEHAIHTARLLALRLDPVATHRGDLAASLAGLQKELADLGQGTLQVSFEDEVGALPTWLASEIYRMVSAWVGESGQGGDSKFVVSVARVVGFVRVEMRMQGGEMRLQPETWEQLQFHARVQHGQIQIERGADGNEMLVAQFPVKAAA